MSKKHQQEIAEKKREQELERQSKILSAVARHLDRFGEILPRGLGTMPLTETGIEAYVSALGHLTPEQLDRACDETLKVCTFFPKPAEILKAYADWIETQPQGGTAIPYRKGEPLTEHEAKLLREAFDAIEAVGEPMKGLRWNREDDIEDFDRHGKRPENGWRPREESLRLETERASRKITKPHFNVIDKRIAPAAMREPGED